MSRVQEAGSVLRVGFAFSKSPNFHLAYFVCNRTFIAVCTLLSCSVIVIEVTWDNVKICFFPFFQIGLKKVSKLDHVNLIVSEFLNPLSLSFLELFYLMYISYL